MTLPESIAIGGLGLSFLGSMVTVIGFMYRMTKDVSEIKKQVTNDLQHIAEVEDAKRGRVYERLDAVKKIQDEKFVVKEMCVMQHNLLHSDIAEMKADIKVLLKRGG
jgi:hypothetical protein